MPSDANTSPAADPSNEPIAPPERKRSPTLGTPPDVNPARPGASPAQESSLGASDRMPPGNKPAMFGRMLHGRSEVCFGRLLKHR